MNKGDVSATPSSTVSIALAEGQPHLQAAQAILIIAVTVHFYLLTHKENSIELGMLSFEDELSLQKEYITGTPETLRNFAELLEAPA